MCLGAACVVELGRGRPPPRHIRQQVATVPRRLRLRPASAFSSAVRARPEDSWQGASPLLRAAPLALQSLCAYLD